MRGRRSKYPPTQGEKAAELLALLSNGSFFKTIPTAEMTGRQGKGAVRLSYKKSMIDLPGGVSRKEASAANRMARMAQEKILKAELRKRKADYKREGLSARAAEEKALEDMSGIYGYSIDSLERFNSGKADVERRKPKELRAHSRRKKRAKNTL